MIRFTIMLAFCLIFEGQAQEARVLIIGVDGCRADVIASASTPNIDNLMQSGYYTLNGLTEAPTWSGVGWTGMVTGVWRNKHGVDNNSYSGQNLSYPHFFKLINDHDPSLNKYSIVHWGPINTHLANFNAGEQQFTYGTDQEVENKAVDVLTNENPHVMFLHFDDVDYAGHAVGFVSSQQDYIEAIETADSHIGSVLTALYARPNYSSENWLIMVSTDHGGIGSGHGGSTLDERTIFIVAAGNVDQIGEATISQSNYSTSSTATFDASSGSYIDAGDPVGNLVFGSNDITIECWVRTNGWTSDPAIVSNKDWNSGYNEGFVLAGTTDGSSWKFNIGNGGVVRYDLSGSSIDDGAWHHLAVSVDRDGEIIAYQDGSITDQVTISGSIDVDSDLNLSFGQDGTGSYPAGMDSELSEVRIWKSVVSQNNLVSYMCQDVDANHPNQADLVGYWPLNDATGATAQDVIGSNNGTLNGNTSWNNTTTDRICYDLSDIPKIVDIPFTALTHLCVDIDQSWELDGQSFGVNPCLLTSIDEIEDYISIILEDGLLQIVSDNSVQYELYDSSGRIIYSEKTSSFEYYLPSNGVFLLVGKSSDSEVKRYKVVNTH